MLCFEGCGFECLGLGLVEVKFCLGVIDFVWYACLRLLLAGFFVKCLVTYVGLVGVCLSYGLGFFGVI